MSEDKLIFSLKQAREYNDYGYEVPLDRVEFIVQNNMPALRLVLNEEGFKRDPNPSITGSSNSLKKWYGTKKNKNADAMQNFCKDYAKKFTEKGIKNFKESDSSIIVFLPDDLNKAIDIVNTVNEFTYQGNIKAYNSNNDDESAVAKDVNLITQHTRLEQRLREHFFKVHEKTEQTPICDKVFIVNDGNALVGIDRFQSIKNYNPRTVDTSVYAVVFFPKKSEQLQQLHHHIMQAAYLTPDYYEEYVRPKTAEKEYRQYSSPNYYIKKDKDNNLEAHEHYITIQQDFVLLREINIHDLKNFLKELEFFNVLEPNSHIAGEIFNAINSEYRSPIKKGKYDREPDLYETFADLIYDGATLENYTFAKDSGELKDGKNYKIFIELLKDDFQSAVHSKKSDPKKYYEKLQKILISLHALAKGTVEGEIKILDYTGENMYPALKNDSELTNSSLIKSRMEKLLHDIIDFEKGDDIHEKLSSFAATHSEKRAREVWERSQNIIKQSMDIDFSAEVFEKEMDYRDRINAANRSEDERTGGNRHRVKASESVMIHNGSLPQIPYFDRRSSLSEPQAVFVPIINPYVDYSSKKPGEVLFDTVNLDEFYKGLEDKLPEYLKSIEKNDVKGLKL